MDVLSVPRPVPQSAHDAAHCSSLRAGLESHHKPVCEQARQELQMSGVEALAKASLELKISSVDRAGHLHGIEFQVDRAEQ